MAETWKPRTSIELPSNMAFPKFPCHQFCDFQFGHSAGLFPLDYFSVFGFFCRVLCFLVKKNIKIQHFCHGIFEVFGWLLLLLLVKMLHRNPWVKCWSPRKCDTKSPMLVLDGAQLLRGRDLESYSNSSKCGTFTGAILPDQREGHGWFSGLKWSQHIYIYI